MHFVCLSRPQSFIKTVGPCLVLPHRGKRSNAVIFISCPVLSISEHEMFFRVFFFLHGAQQNVHLLHLLCSVHWKLIFLLRAHLYLQPSSARDPGDLHASVVALPQMGSSLTPEGTEEVILVRREEQTRAILCQNESAGRTRTVM